MIYYNITGIIISKKNLSTYLNRSFKEIKLRIREYTIYFIISISSNII
jgi:hypothetical protein